MSPTVLPTAQREPSGLSGRTVLILFLGFFATIFAVNGAMMFYALKTHSGLVSNEPYRKGLHYNERIAESERQALLGWTDAAKADMSGLVTIELKGRDGAPVTGLHIAGFVGRPAATREDTPLRFMEAEPGTYVVQGKPLAEGTWLLAFEARRAAPVGAPEEPVVYKSRRRLWLKP